MYEKGSYPCLWGHETPYISRVSWEIIWVSRIFPHYAWESIARSPLNTGDMIGANSLPLMSRIEVVSLFTVTYHGLHYICGCYIRTVIIIAYVHVIMAMIRRDEPSMQGWQWGGLGQVLAQPEPTPHPIEQPSTWSYLTCRFWHLEPELYLQTTYPNPDLTRPYSLLLLNI